MLKVSLGFCPPRCDELPGEGLPVHEERYPHLDNYQDWSRISIKMGVSSACACTAMLGGNEEVTNTLIRSEIRTVHRPRC